MQKTLPSAPLTFPLSPIQQGMLLHMLKAPDSGFDIEQMVLTTSEWIEPVALRQAWERLVARHGVFRTSFKCEGLAEPRQYVHNAVPLSWVEFDWSALDAGERQARFTDFLAQDRKSGFDPSAAPLTRFALFRFQDQEWRFVWTFHHMLADGQSYPALLSEVFEYYEAAKLEREVTLPDPRPYDEFIRWQKEHQRDSAARAEAYWRKALGGFSSPTSMPERPEHKAGEETHGEVSVDIPTSARLREFTKSHGLTLNAMVQAAWSIVLARNSGQEDVIFGVTRACRKNTISGADDVVGLFINTLPTRVRVNPSQNVAEWLNDLNQKRKEVRDFEHTPLVDLHRWSDVPPNTTLFESIVVFTPRLIGRALQERGGVWAKRDIRFLERTNYPLTLFAYAEDSVLLKLCYDRRRYSAKSASRWIAQLKTVLEGMAINGNCTVGEVPYLPEEERQQLLTGWNQTRRDFASDSTIHGEIEKQAARTPPATALVFRNQTLTYAELNRRANLLAHRLRSAGVGPESYVGIFVDRSIEMVVGLMATLKAGAAYVPLDPKYPRERIGWMLEDTRATVVLTQEALLKSLPLHANEIISLDNPGLWDAASETLADGAGGATSANLAYVLFTSGSSGRPKGVMIEHRNVMNFFAGMDETLEHRTGGTWLAVTSISFDISVLELFWTLSRGFKVVLQSEEDRLAPATGTAGKRMDFSLFYFSADAAQSCQDKYRLLLEGARFADRNGFSAVWTPERHFHEFGGLYPNPAVTSAAIAAITQQVQIRAGSVVLPLHNPIRVAEEWAVVDNLSGGRVGLSFASGWHKNDFALMPQNWARRKELMFEGIETIRTLWRGQKVAAKNGAGEDIEVGIFPAPIQLDPQIWITTAGNIDTFRAAGQAGGNILTNLLGQKPEELRNKIDAYRQARSAAGHEGTGSVTLMLHTFVGTDTERVREVVRRPFLDYLKTSTELVKQARWEFPAFAQPGKDRITPVENAELNEEEVEALMSHAFDRYFQTSGLFGSIEDCRKMVESLKDIGVDEIACLVDFGVATQAVLDSLSFLNQLREESNTIAEDFSIAGQIRRHNVTHLQCTPSMARMLASEENSLDSLRGLEKLLLGGEALPPGLAEQLNGNLRGDLVNMYGPTETTVWSTTATISQGTEITIGRPIANTRIYIVDRNLQLAPIGAAAELLIGGDGVARGYLGRAELTAERFVTSPFDAGRLYRTGDMARYREDGRIEFLRRLDSQVKIRGHRIELGDIEAAIAEHPGVWETAVVAQADPSGDAQLVAYVVPQASCQESCYGQSAGDVVKQWGSLWDEAYRNSHAADAAFDVRGWRSSYTGDALPEAEMREWVDATVARIRALKPKRVLEIGVGTGLLLFRIAPDCEVYEGVDLSVQALRSIEQEAERRGLSQVRLRQAAAAELTDLEPASFDAVVINSVIQYFPSAEYLAQVLEQASRAVRSGGAIFIGDVRNQKLLRAFHVSVELDRAPASMSRGELRDRVEQRCQAEHELLVDPEFFREFARHHTKLGHVAVQLKRGRARNEMTRFRYDVVLHVGERLVENEPATVIAGVPSLDAIQTRLLDEPSSITFAGLTNSRLDQTTRALEWLDGDHAPGTVGELRDHLAESARGFDPEDLWNLDRSYEVELDWSENAGEFNATFRRPVTLQRVEFAAPAERRRDWNEFVNPRPVRQRGSSFTRDLRDHVTGCRPDYMVPSAFVLLDALPRTPNGKVDWKSLPAPDRVRQEASVYQPPVTEHEQIITEVWAGLLNLERVGAEDNFFDLGANSLTMVQAVAPLRERLRCSLSLVDLFRYPSPRALAGHVRGSQQPEEELNGSQQRGRARLDAMLRRVAARQVAAEAKGA